jgi:hypothetical protein
LKTSKAPRNVGIIASLLFLPLVFAPVAYANQSTTLIATFTFNITPTSVTQHGGNTITTFTDVVAITGGAVGTVNCAGVLVTHSDGTYNYRCEGTFTGTVKGGSGPGTAAVRFSGSGSGTTTQAKEVWDHGTGGLYGIYAKISVVATFTSATGGVGTKTMHVTFNRRN